MCFMNAAADLTEGFLRTDGRHHERIMILTPALRLPSLTMVTTELQTAGPYLHMLSTSPPPSDGRRDFASTRKLRIYTQVLKPPADTLLSAQLFMFTKRQYEHSKQS